jgi:hypothetical protein
VREWPSKREVAGAAWRVRVEANVRKKERRREGEKGRRGEGMAGGEWSFFGPLICANFRERKFA